MGKSRKLTDQHKRAAYAPLGGYCVPLDETTHAQFKTAVASVSAKELKEQLGIRSASGLMHIANTGMVPSEDVRERLARAMERMKIPVPIMDFEI